MTPIRVVVVDDQRDLCRLLVLLLQRDQRLAVVAEAHDGVEGLAAVDAHDPDVLLLDLAMPRMDGLEVLDKLRSRHRPAVVVLTGFTDQATSDRARRLGAYDCLDKGSGFGDLAGKLIEAAGATPSDQDDPDRFP